jgi:VanZ family protein
MAILTKEILAAEFGDAEYNKSLFQDMAINIAGFIPMGVLLAALLWQANRRDVKKQLLLVILTCGAISLMIELAQAWIPSRSSQLLDFILNMLGAGIGVIGHSVYRNYLIRKPPETRSPGH